MDKSEYEESLASMSLSSFQGTDGSKENEVLLERFSSNSKNDYTSKVDDQSVCDRSYEFDLNKIARFKDSTKKLIYLIEKIQKKTCFKNIDSQNENNELIVALGNDSYFENIIGGNALQKLEYQAKKLDLYQADYEPDDCSTYKRLTRQCQCLNRNEFNDFTIHFNENTKYFTTDIGEIIKNMRILKKFLYINGSHAKNALAFLNEGLSDASRIEKNDIINGISHADMCNVFENESIVVTYIAWPCSNLHYQDTEIQALTASFLSKLSQVEEGRRYLNCSSKITADIKRVLRKKVASLEDETVESLNSTLTMLQRSTEEHGNINYYCRAPDKGMSSNLLQMLLHNRQFMTYEEISIHLNLLQNISAKDSAKPELNTNLPIILSLFKQLIMEYDSSEMNIILISILNNIMTGAIEPENVSGGIETTLITTDTCTEVTVMKSEIEQFPPIAKKSNAKTKSKLKFGVCSTLRSSNFHKSRETKGHNFTIIVPLETNTY